MSWKVSKVLRDKQWNDYAPQCLSKDNEFPSGSLAYTLSKWEKLKMFIAGVIENHKRDWNPAEARDFVDAYDEMIY